MTYIAITSKGPSIKSILTMPRIVASILLLFALNCAMAGEEEYVARSSSTLTIGTTVEVVDDKLDYMQNNIGWENVFSNRAANGYVMLYIDPACMNDYAAFTAQVGVDVTYYDETNTPYSFSYNFNIDFDPAANTSFTNKDLLKFPDAHKIEVEVTSVTNSLGSFPQCIRLKSELRINRHYIFDPTDIPTPVSSLISSNTEVEVAWDFVQGAEEYELEWLYVDDYKGAVSQPYYATTALDYDFEQYAVRVTTPFNAYVFPNVFEHGYVLYRVRAVGRHAANIDYRLDGQWSGTADSGLVSNFTDRITVSTAHQADAFNWSYNASYAEQGKRQEQVSYFDGTMKNRQSVGYIQSLQEALVQETFYDYQGRPGVFTLPAPADDRALKYYDDFNRNSSNTEYTVANFDLNPSDSCSINIDSMSDGYGASRYYSTNNPDLDGQQAFVPDANEYPFSRVEYTNDLTGRIRRQGGFGIDYQLDTDHETRYFYGDPVQGMLYRLFGTDVGYSLNYKEVVVMDANGQMTSSIIDQNGNVIATSVAGGAHPDMQVLSSNNGTEVDTASLLDLNELDSNNINQPVISMVRTHVVKSAGYYSFDYGFETQVFRDSCLPANMCLECVYDLEMSIKDDCGREKIPGGKITERIGNVPWDLDCNDSIQYNDTFSVYLEVGEYTFSKILKVNLGVVDYYVDAYIDSAACLSTYADFLAAALDSTDFSGCGLTPCGLSCLDSLGTLTEYVLAGGDSLTYDSLYTRCLIACSRPEPCEWMYNSMAEDLTPGGQYAYFRDTTNALNPAAFPLSILNANNQLPASGASWRNPTTPYLNYDGTPDSITLNGVKYIPGHDSVDVWTFILNWKDTWMASLIEYHPEYCYYQNCLDNAASEEWDYDLTIVTDYSIANSSGLLDPIGMTTGQGRPVSVTANTTNIDPFFDTGGMGAPFIGTLKDQLENFWIIGTSNYTLWEASLIMTYCAQVDDESEADSCLSAVGSFGSDDCKKNQIWSLFKDGYKAAKYQIYDSLRTDYAVQNGCYNGCIGSATHTQWYNSYGCHPYNNVNFPCDADKGTGYNLANDTTQPCSDATAALYANKIPTFYSLPFEEDSLDAMVGSLWSGVSGEGDSSCFFKCGSFADAWMLALNPCGFTSIDSADIRQKLIDICALGCDVFHPNGGSTTAPDTFLTVYSGDTIRSFEDVFTYIYPSYIDDSCSSYLIMDPRPYDQQVISSGIDTCACDAVLHNREDFNNLSILPPGVTDEESYFFYQYGHYLNDFDGIACECNNAFEEAGAGAWAEELHWSDEAEDYLATSGLLVPHTLRCQQSGCTNCDTLDAYISDFDAYMGASYSSSPYYDQMLTNFINHNHNKRWSPLQTENFRMHCDSVLGTAGDTVSLCPTSPFQPMDTIDDCTEMLMQYAAYNAQQAYDAYIDSVKGSVRRRYIAKCIEAMDTEWFDMTHPTNSYHFTLYYYDQSGLLVKTVPPAGVNPFSFGQIAAVKAARVSGTALRPAHTMATDYRYNSLNGLVSMESPDGGETNYWYDAIGRLILSQNAQQLIDRTASYTFYDRWGRIAEVGQANTGIINADDLFRDSILYDTAVFRDWIEAVHREQITRTFYDESLSSEVVAAFGSSGQQNLRLRVASTAYYDTLAPDTAYLYATHFSYDVHGNVQMMIQDIKPLEMSGQRFKRIGYEYDLISGNVHAVHYQQDSTDAFHHRYCYDDDNRLTIAETSPQAEIWHKDAKYFYYDHGPLARIEHGEYQVQAEDISYTINGWVKGTNSNALDTALDQGHDGHTGYLSYNDAMHAHFAKDAVSYSLGYYQGDYSAIGGATANDWLANLSGSGLLDQSSQLHNGNIGQMITNWSDMDAQGMAYTYDQLNRLVGSRAFDNLSASTNAWSSGGIQEDYRSRYSYDPNGNLLELTRRGYGANLDLDSLDYHYTAGTNQLTHVDDAVSSAYATDIDDQSASNYSYTALGQLAADASEEAQYRWNVYGKIKEVNRTSSSERQELAFHYDPQGNRVLKQVKPRTGGVPTTQDQWLETWYVRDLQGNTMAVYESSYTSTGTPGTPATGYAVMKATGGPDNNDLEITINGASITANTAQWQGSGTATATAFADSVNAYTSVPNYLATASNDTVYLTAAVTGSWANGHVVAGGPNNDIALTVSNMAGGTDGSALYTQHMDAKEHHIYGSSRLGVSKHLDTTTSQVSFTAQIDQATNLFDLLLGTGGGGAFVTTQNSVPTSTSEAVLSLNGGAVTVNASATIEVPGSKLYEYTNHLGNVLLTTSDRALTTGGEFFPSWTDVQYFAINSANQSLTANGGGVGWANNPGEAFSVESIPGDGYVEHTINSNALLSRNIGVGLSYANVAGNPLITIDYCIWQAYTGQQFQVRVGGSNVYNVPGTFAAGDVVRIERIGTTIYFKINGVSVYSTSEFGSGDLHADVACSRTGQSVQGLTIMTGPMQRVADVQSYSDYYPYGWAMVGRNTNLSDYRFGMNGMELDNEASGDGNSYTTFFRQYDPRLGRWTSKDPVIHAWQSPYNAFDANPIFFADPSGADGDPPGVATGNAAPINNTVAGQGCQCSTVNASGDAFTEFGSGFDLSDGVSYAGNNLPIFDRVGDAPSIGEKAFYHLARLDGLAVRSMGSSHGEYETEVPAAVEIFTDIFPPSAMVRAGNIIVTGEDPVTLEKASSSDYTFAVISLIPGGKAFSLGGKALNKGVLRIVKESVETTYEIWHKGGDDINSYLAKKGWTAEEVARVIEAGNSVIHNGENFITGKSTRRFINPDTPGKDLLMDEDGVIIQLGKAGYNW